MTDATKLARLVYRAGEDAAWLDALAVSLTDSKRYVIAGACRKRALEIGEFVRSLRDEVCSTCDGEGEIQGEPGRDPEDDGMRICPTCDGEVRTSPESATEHARRIAG